MLPKKKELDINFVYKLYIEDNCSRKEVARLCGCSDSKIKSFLAEHNIIKSMDKRVECHRAVCLKTFGVDNPSKVQCVKDKKVATCRERLGVDYPLQNAAVMQKLKDNNVKTYGVEYPCQSPVILEKRKKTCEIVYGVEHVLQNEEVKEKGRQTNLKIRGVDNAAKDEKVKAKTRRTCKVEYGFDFACQSEEVKNKIEETNLRIYGHTCSLLNEKVKQKKEDTCIKRYGHACSYKNEEVKRKGIETKRRNGTFNTSKPEITIRDALLKKFNVVECQYRSDDYPFLCDFYLPEIDLYIEFQGLWTHGFRPFDSQDTQCLSQLNLWREKAKKSNFYKNAIHVWTVTDPLKRETAKENGLNWIEFFDMSEFNNWLEKQEGVHTQRFG